jgi:hypothetical protein
VKENEKKGPAGEIVLGFYDSMKRHPLGVVQVLPVSVSIKHPNLLWP